MTEVLRRRGITLRFLNIIDSYEVKVNDTDCIFIQEKLLIIILHAKKLLYLYVYMFICLCSR